MPDSQDYVKRRTFLVRTAKSAVAFTVVDLLSSNEAMAANCTSSPPDATCTKDTPTAYYDADEGCNGAVVPAVDEDASCGDPTGATGPQGQPVYDDDASCGAAPQSTTNPNFNSSDSSCNLSPQQTPSGANADPSDQNCGKYVFVNPNRLPDDDESCALFPPDESGTQG